MGRLSESALQEVAEVKARSVREQILVRKYKVLLVLGVIITHLSVIWGHNMPLMITDVS